MTARIPCCVPYCKRTAPQHKHPKATEVICAKHYRSTSKELRKLHKRLTQKLEDLWDRYGGVVPAHLDPYIFRLCDIDNRVWEKIKAQAIESAGGLR